MRIERRTFLQFPGAAALWGAASCQAGAAPGLVRFGRTDLRVTRVCLGTAFRKNRRDPDDPNAQAALRRAIDIGINFFDSSNAYGWGGSELALGKAMRGSRQRLVICTKVHPGRKPEDTERAKSVAFTREFAFAECEGSLKRLGTDYLDLYLLHNPDGVTPEEEVAATMEALVRSGKIRYWGVSNHKAGQVEKFAALGAGKPPALAIAAVQNHYNILNRELEREMFPVLRRNGIGLMPFGPLEEGRLVEVGRTHDEAKTALIVAIDSVARQVRATRAQVLLAWVMSRPEATCVLTAAETPEQVEENYRAMAVRLNAEAVAALDAASDAYAKARAKTG